MKIAVIVAMDSEYKRLKQLGDTIGGHTVILEKGGIGKVNAAIKTLELIEHHHPDCIISSGVAGGLDTVVKVMDIVVAEEVCYHDVWCGEGNAIGQVQGLPPRFNCNPSLLSNIQPSTNIHKGLICTGDRFITNDDEKSIIKNHFPDALAVDMESAAIAQVCHIKGIPFMAMRIVSDTPGDTDDHSRQYADFWGEMAEKSFSSVANLLKIIPTQL